MHTMEFYTAGKKSEIITFAGEWIRKAKLGKTNAACSPSSAYVSALHKGGCACVGIFLKVIDPLLNTGIISHRGFETM